MFCVYQQLFLQWQSICFAKFIIASQRAIISLTRTKLGFTSFIFNPFMFQACIENGKCDRGSWQVRRHRGPTLNQKVDFNERKIISIMVPLVVSSCGHVLEQVSPRLLWNTHKTLNINPWTPYKPRYRQSMQAISMHIFTLQFSYFNMWPFVWTILILQMFHPYNQCHYHKLL